MYCITIFIVKIVIESILFGYWSDRCFCSPFLFVAFNVDDSCIFQTAATHTHTPLLYTLAAIIWNCALCQHLSQDFKIHRMCWVHTNLNRWEQLYGYSKFNIKSNQNLKVCVRVFTSVLCINCCVHCLVIQLWRNMVYIYVLRRLHDLCAT